MANCLIGLLLLAVLGLGAWFVWALIFSPEPPARRSSWGGHSGTYESPLGLVDNPDDEWVEWAIMDDLLDE